MRHVVELSLGFVCTTGLVWYVVSSWRDAVAMVREHRKAGR